MLHSVGLFYSSLDMTSWNLIICTIAAHFQPVVIEVPDPTKWTASQLRSEAAKKLGYPEEDLTLYCNEAVLPEVNHWLSVKG